MGGALGLQANCSFLCFSSFLILWHFFVYVLCIWFMPCFNTSPHCLFKNILPPLPLPPLPSFVLLVPCVQEDLLSFSKWNEYQHVFLCTFPLASSCKFYCGYLIEVLFLWLLGALVCCWKHLFFHLEDCGVQLYNGFWLSYYKLFIFIFILYFWFFVFKIFKL